MSNHTGALEDEPMDALASALDYLPHRGGGARSRARKSSIGRRRLPGR
jgi:hypothetical protein